MVIREPQAAAWGFYPLNRVNLERELERCFRDPTWGPGTVPQRGKARDHRVVAGVVPHAGYSYSGACAAWFYKELAESHERLDLVVLLGTNHSGFGSSITTTSYYTRWATPLGVVDVDLEFIKKLRGLYPSLDDDALAHTREHSLEVQLPFLQFIYGNTFKIVPVVVKDVDAAEAREFSKALKEVIDEYGKNAVVIASSDFTHHGYIYGYMPFRENISLNVRKLDEELIGALLSLDTRLFLSLISKYSATVCGHGAIAIVMEYAKTKNAKGRLLKYYHSADVTGDEDVVVGYASIGFYV